MLLQDRAGVLPSLVVVCGDHGMSEHGSHGGSTPSETDTPLLFTGATFQHGHGGLLLLIIVSAYNAFSALTLLVWWEEGHPACKKTEWWDAGMVICLERGADLHMSQLMPLPLTVSCFSEIQIGFTFLVPAHPGSPRKRAIKWVCVCVLGSCCMVVRKSIWPRKN